MRQNIHKSAIYSILAVRNVNNELLLITASDDKLVKVWKPQRVYIL